MEKLLMTTGAILLFLLFIFLILILLVGIISIIKAILIGGKKDGNSK